jgi:hypothetical protein
MTVAKLRLATAAMRQPERWLEIFVRNCSGRPPTDLVPTCGPVWDPADGRKQHFGLSTLLGVIHFTPASVSRAPFPGGVRTSLRALEEWGPGAFPLPVEAPAETFFWRVSPYEARTAGLPAAGVSAQVAWPSGGLVAKVAPGIAPQACGWESAPAISARVAPCQGTRLASGALTCRELPAAVAVAETPVWRSAVSDAP